MTTSAERAPESTMDLGWRIAMSAAMMNVSSPILSQPARHRVSK
jgi:hypothetical protein